MSATVTEPVGQSQTAGPVKELLGLKRQTVGLGDLLLDPNNPRFGNPGTVSEERIGEQGVQEAAMQKIEDIGIGDLVSSIQRYGFAPTDPLVVKKLKGGKFVVIEGNRRVASLKKIHAANIRG